MTQERQQELLRIVKIALFGSSSLLIADDPRDDTLIPYIVECVYWMKSAGVSDAVIATDRINGAVIRGVTDLWNYGQGNAELSPHFHKRVIQLTREVV